MIHTTEKNLTEHGDKVDAAVKSEIEAKIKELRDVLDSAETAELRTKTEALAQASMKLGEAMYKASQEAQAAAGAAGGAAGGEGGASEHPSPKDESVVDAEFHEVDDKKNKSA